jgi:DNA-binding transcriptional ArsR family regulator
LNQPTEALDRTLEALADPDRRRAIDLLRVAPRTAGELAEAIGVPPPAMSRHLRVLRESGLVELRHPQFDARLRIYSLRTGPMAALREWLDETEAMWAAQLSSFKQHIEGQ